MNKYLYVRESISMLLRRTKFKLRFNIKYTFDVSSNLKMRTLHCSKGRNEFQKRPPYWWPSTRNNYTSSHWFWLIALGAMFQVPTASANISKGCRVFCRLSAWSIGRRSFGKLPASSRSRKLWLTSARLFYRDGFFLSGPLCPREVTSRLYSCALLASMWQMLVRVCVCMYVYTNSPCTHRSLHFTSQHPPGCVRWHRQRFYLDRWDSC